MSYSLPRLSRSRRLSLRWPDLFTMWRNPVMVAWFVVAFFLLFVVRLPFARLGMVPYFVEFHPGFVLLPILGICWGPAAAWAALAAGMAGDALLGYWESVSFFRAIGWMVAVLCTQRLYTMRMESNKGKPAGVRAILFFLLLSLPACCAAAVWPAVQAGFLRYYPYCYIVALSFLNNIVFLLLFGPGLFRLLSHHTDGEICLWRRHESPHGLPHRTLRLSRAMVWLGSVGSLVMGLLVSGLAYHAWPWSLYLIGTSTGSWVRVVVAAFLGLLVTGLCLPVFRPDKMSRQTSTRTRVGQGSSFGDLYLPS